MNLNNIKKIYEEAFGIDKEFEDKLFADCIKHCRTLEIGGKIVSMLFLLPVSINIRNERKDACYLFAAATAKENRGKGYMSELLNNIVGEISLPIILKPADDSLIEFYKKFGFKTFTAKYNGNNGKCILPKDEFLLLGVEPENKKGNYIAMYFYKEEISLDNITFSYTME